jgi:hypothetical protein
MSGVAGGSGGEAIVGGYEHVIGSNYQGGTVSLGLGGGTPVEMHGGASYSKVWCIFNCKPDCEKWEGKMRSSDVVLKEGIGMTAQALLVGLVGLIAISLLVAIAYAFLLYHDVILLAVCLPISLTLFLCIGSFFFYPARVVIDEAALRCSFVVGQRVILLDNIMWVKKMFPRMCFKGDEALLWVVIKSKHYNFLYRYCVFRIRGKGFGLRGRDYITLLDHYLEGK